MGNTFEGGYLNDQLYGGSGDEVIIAGAGDDYIEGNKGVDFITGGLDNDILLGGEGSDLYIFSTGDGKDVIFDGVGFNEIQYDGIILDGGTLVSGSFDSSAVYKSSDGLFQYSYDPSLDTLKITRVNGGNTNDLITIINASNSRSLSSLPQESTNDFITTLKFLNDPIYSSGSPGNINNIGFGITLTDSTTPPATYTNQIDGDSNLSEPDDSLTGTSSNDEIYGLTGNDDINGRDGDDFLDGGTGNDTVYGDDLAAVGSGGYDTIYGGDGVDILYGGEGNDTVYGGLERDIIRGDGQQAASLGEDRDTLYGEDGDDFISGAFGSDTIYGGDGSDLLVGGEGADAIAGGLGADYIFGDAEIDSISSDWTITVTSHSGPLSKIVTINNADGLSLTSSDDGGDIIQGGAGDDYIEGGGGSDQIYGGADNDFIIGGDGGDFISGGSGTDAIHGDVALDYSVTGNDIILAGDGDDNVQAGLGDDVIHGGDGNDILYGDDPDLDANSLGGDDLIRGGLGEDNIHGGIGNDTIYGDAGIDSISAGEGDDYVDGGDDNDIILGGTGADTILGGSGDDLITGEEDNDTIFGGDGLDELQGSTGDDSIFGEAGADRLFGEDGNDNLFGGDGADELIAGLGNDVLYGGAGDDMIWGEFGTDTIIGGTGNDTLIGGAGDDTYVYGVGDGVDTIYEQSDSNLDVLNISGTTGDYTAYRSSYNLVLSHGNGVDSLVVDGWFLDSASQLSRVSFSGGTSWTTSEAESVASLIVKGTDSVDYITGTDSAQSIEVFGGDDQVYGRDGDDVITGGTGNDSLWGDAGNDTYIFDLGDGHDVIYNGDSVGIDTLHFGVDFTPGNMVYERQGDDLLISHSVDVGGTLVSDSITVKYWYSNSGYQLDQITFESDPNTVLTNQMVSDLGVYIDHTYLFNIGDGNRTIEDWGGQDTIVVDSSISSIDIITQRTGNDLVLQHSNGIDSLTIVDWFNDTQKQIERVEFVADSTVWLADDITSPLLDLIGTSGVDILISGDAYGDAYGEALSGLDGDDKLYGHDGNDILSGGKGNDEMYGGFGKDIYTFSAGDGIDYIEDEDEPRWNFDTIHFDASIDPTTVTSEDEGIDLRVTYGDGDEILIDNYYHYSTTGLNRTIKYVEFVIDGSANNDNITGSNQVFISDSHAYDIIYGFAGDDVILAGAGDDYIYGGDGNDTIYESDGADKMYGGAGNDTLGTYWALSDTNRTGDSRPSYFIGGSGNDIIYGTSHKDTYEFNLGDGIDTVYEQPYRNGGPFYFSYDDKLILGEGITTDSISLDSSGDDLLVTVSPTDILTFKNHFYTSAYAVDYIKFADGTTWDSGDIMQQAFTQIGTEGDDILSAEYYQMDALYGMGGNDTLNGNSGDDLLDGGTGNDFLNGSYDNDTYIFDRGYGRDVISDNRTSSSGLNSVQFGAGVTAADLSYSREANDLVLTINDTGDQLVISDFLISADSRKFSFSFTDSSQLPINQQMYDDLIHITGDYTANTLVGSDGYDVIDGAGGDDILTGNMGDDLLEGGTGNDLYLYALGDGRDTINNYDLTGGRVDAVVFDTTVTTSNVQARRNSDDLKLSMSDGGELLVTNHFAGDTSSGYAIDEIRFNDGTIWNISDSQTKVLEATTGSDYLYGLSSADTLSGLTGNDTIIGNGGADNLSGDEGNDSLDGGIGDDILAGGAGSDIYFFGVGYGTDTIDNNDDSSGRYDRIELLPGITASDIRISRVGDDLVLSLTDSGAQISVTNHFLTKGKNRSSYIDAIYFSDGSSWSRTNIDSLIASSPDGHYTFTGTNGDDILAGYGGNDTLIGGTGNDSLDGGSGSDIYTYSLGDGNDVISNYDTNLGKTDVIDLSSGIAVSDVVAERTNDDLVLNMSDGGSITVSNYFVQNGTAGYAVDEVRFNDGTVWSISDVLAMLIQNEAPIASDDVGSVSEDNTVVFLVSDLISNDSDVDGDPLSITGASNAVNGSVTFDDIAGTITFTPDENYFGPASFEYILSDGLQTDTALVNIDVTPLNDAPVAQADTAQVERDCSVVINVADLLANDTEVDGELLSVVSVSNALNGVAVFDDIAGTVTFTPNASYVGGASFEYTIIDGNSTSSAAVSVNVTLRNSAPTVIDDAVTTTQDNALVINASDLLVNDSDVEGDAIQVVGIQNATNGAAVFDDVAQTVTFMPDPYYTGPAQFEYIVSDGMGQSTGLVNVDVALDTSGAVVGSSGNDTLSGGRQGETFYGLSGDDTIDGGRGNDQLIGGSGNDTLLGDGGHDTYVAGIGAGIDLIDNSTSGKNDNDILHMVGGDPYDLWFSQDGNDLLVDVVGTSDQVRIQGWYANSSNELDGIHTADSILINNNVNQLVSAMSAFSVPAGEGAEISQNVREQIDPVISVSWQSSWN